jgi:hypothetical protein
MRIFSIYLPSMGKFHVFSEDYGCSQGVKACGVIMITRGEPEVL